MKLILLYIEYCLHCTLEQGFSNCFVRCDTQQKLSSGTWGQVFRHITTTNIIVMIILTSTTTVHHDLDHRQELEAKFGDKVEVTGEGTPDTTGYLEVKFKMITDQ